MKMADPRALLAADITDADEDWVVRLLGLPDNAFRGAGNDPRGGFLRRLDSIDVSACPGSGKTTLLVAKLAILASKWTPVTQGICVLSHTNAARLEIESRLATSSVGQTLLSYPHYVGTIHTFVNTFMAVPWLRSQGYAVKMIDSDRCHEMRLAALTYGARSYLTQRHLDMNGIRVVDADFNVERSAGGALPCGPHTPTYRAIQNACRELAVNGYHCYEDAFIWATDLIQKHPDLVGALRDRFPFVFMDEAQDNSEEQSSLLFQVFCQGPSVVTRERLGDPNQAIYDFVGQTGASTDPFPGPSKLDLPCSHRFGRAIASLSDPFGLAPHAMVGAGPRQPIEGFTGANILLLFDPASIDQVLSCYGQILIDSFPDSELADGSFVAVGQVHRRPAAPDPARLPEYVGDYWADYDAAMSPRKPVRDRFLQYAAAGIQASSETKETHPAVSAIAEGVLRLVTLMGGARELPSASSPHRRVLAGVRGREGAVEDYLRFIERFAIRGEQIKEAQWDQQLKPTVLEWGKIISGENAPNAKATDFLLWPTGMVNGHEDSGRHANVFLYPPESPTVRIRVGSIHSVKGETHMAILVLETHWHDHNLESISEWLLGIKTGQSGQARRDSRLKTHYVAMTRPSHMLCLAMKAATFEKDGELDPDRVAALEAQGWTIRRLTGAAREEPAAQVSVHREAQR